MASVQDLEEKLVLRLPLARVRVESGPVVDRHYFRVTSGVRFSDLQSAISKCGFYMDWCRGDNYDQIVVEVPHENHESVSLSDLMSTPEFRNATAEVQSENCESISLADLMPEPELQIAPATLPMILGCDTLGQPVIADLSDMPHMLVAGDNGTGKTTLLRSIVRSIAARSTPDKCKFMILNLPWGDVADTYLAWPPIADDAEAALAGLRIVVAEMERRCKLLSAAKTNNIDMPRLIVMIDDLSDLMVASRGKVEKYLTQIAQKGRSVGLHMIVATAQCDAKTMSGTLKANFPTRISFHVDTAAKSRQSLGEPGAELLLPYGDALFSDAGRVPVRIHTPNIDG